MNRTKAFNICELLKILLEDDASYYKDKLVMVGNGRVSQFKNNAKYRSSQYEVIEKEKIVQISDTVFEVESSKTSETIYIVDMYADSCSCPSGRSKGLCKHKTSIAHHFGIEQFAVLPSSDAFAMCRYHYMALGRCEEPHWYRQFNRNINLTKLKEFIENLKTNDASNSNTNDALGDINAIEDEEDIIIDNDQPEADDAHDFDYNIEDTSYNNDQEIQDNEDEDDENIPTKLHAFLDDIDTWKQKIISKYNKDPSIRRAVATLHTKIKKQNTGNPETFKRHLFDMGQCATVQIGKGNKKRKSGSVIPVLPHSRSRRKFRHRGNRAVTAGRKFKDPNVARQMVATEESDNVWYQLPSSHKKQKRQEHCLQKDVDLNRSTARKH